LVGAISALEADEDIALAARKSLRFRQYTGDVARIVLEKHGYRKHGKPGWIRTFSKFFTMASRFVPATAAAQVASGLS
jgi:hypothetical protein